MQFLANLFLGWYKGRGAAHSGTHESIERNREFHFLLYGGFIWSQRRKSCLMFTSVPFAMRIRADGILMYVSAEWLRTRSKFKGLTETTFECPRARDAAGLAFLYTQNGHQGEPFRPSRPQNNPRPPRSLMPPLFTSQKRVFRCGVNQTSAKYHLESVPRPSYTSGRSVVFNNPTVRPLEIFSSSRTTTVHSSYYMMALLMRMDIYTWVLSSYRQCQSLSDRTKGMHSIKFSRMSY